MDEVAYHRILRRLGVEPARPAPNPAVVARLLGMPLDRFQQDGALLEVRVPWLPTTLWIAPTSADAEGLVREGVSRGRVWTAGELLDLLALQGLIREQAQTVAHVKVAFDGEVVEVRPGQREGSR